MLQQTQKQRATEKNNFEMLIQADVLLYYISLFYPNNKNTMVVIGFLKQINCFYSLKVLSKSISERYFNKIKVLFGVQDKNQLITKSEK